MSYDDALQTPSDEEEEREEEEEEEDEEEDDDADPRTLGLSEILKRGVYGTSPLFVARWYKMNKDLWAVFESKLCASEFVMRTDIKPGTQFHRSYAFRLAEQGMPASVRTKTNSLLQADFEKFKSECYVWFDCV